MWFAVLARPLTQPSQAGIAVPREAEDNTWDRSGRWKEVQGLTLAPPLCTLLLVFISLRSVLSILIYSSSTGKPAWSLYKAVFLKVGCASESS